jgi:hypothetical protein
LAPPFCDLSEEQLGELTLMGKKKMEPIGRKLKKSKDEKKRKDPKGKNE